ncbi:MAG: glutathione peroxidase [Fibrobacteria bacterium]|nr:glutathione peroxidase [Fibrobacteria bacterium]
MPSIQDFSVPALTGGEIRLSEHAGRVLLLVNTASKCGFTPQYDGLEKLHREYASRGLSVIGFPCDQFKHQEPGSPEEIAEFCRRNHGVTFPLSAKIDVNGKGAHPLWEWLRSQKGGLLGWLGRNEVRWNFTKFLVDRQGVVVARYGSATRPEEIASKIESLL